MTSILDTVAGLGLRMARSTSAVFPGGWGDRLTLELFDHALMTDSVPPAEILWEPKTEHPGIRRRRGLFTSPLAGTLPDGSAVVPVELIEPAVGTDRLVVLMPAWNDEGFESRRELARQLVQLRIAACFFEIPLYGSRREHQSRPMAIDTVADFALMGTGAIVEAHAVLAQLADQFSQLGVGGFSMGGNLAALVAATSTRSLATGVMAASHSPAPVYLDGVLRHALAWRALGGRGAEPELRRMLSAVSTTALAAPPHARRTVAVAGRGDGFVPPSAALALCQHWPGSEIRWIDAGHATLWWRHRDRLVAAIADSFELAP